MRIIDRYIIREIFLAQIAVGLVLGMVIIGALFVRLLGVIVAGGLPVDVLAPLVLMESIKAMIMLTPVTLFLAIMLTLGRLYRDSEMTAMQAAGFGSARLYGGILILVIPLALVLLWLMLYVYPWVSAKSDAIAREGQQQLNVAAVEAGQFVDLASGRLVGFIGALSKHGGMEHIFLRSGQHGKEMVVLAKSGSQRTNLAAGTRSIELDQGIRYEGTIGKTDYRILQFQRYQTILKIPPVSLSNNRLSAMPVGELLRHGGKDAMAELQWRFAVPISALILCFIAVPLSYVRPRQGRFGRLAVAILIYVFYANLIILAKSWMVRGHELSWLGMWWPHAMMLGLGFLLWWWRRHQVAL